MATLSWPYDKCPSSKICSTKQLETIIRPINVKLHKIWNNDPIKSNWGKCTNKRQLSIKQPSIMA